MFHRRWLDKISLRSWSFLLSVDSLSSRVHSLQTYSYPLGMDGANWAFPFIFQALPGTETIALLSLLIPRVASYSDKWNESVYFCRSASISQCFANINPSKTRDVSCEAGKKGDFHFTSGQSKARLVPEVTEVATHKMQWMRDWGRVRQPGTPASRSSPRSRQ